MCNLLQAKVSLHLNEVFFPHPCTKEKVYIIFDGCHMLKLIRNALGSGKDMYDSNDRLISWSHLQSLVEFQDLHGLRAGNKLTKDHILFDQNKMNVKLAAQALSNSVSHALKFLRDRGNILSFSNTEGTEIFYSIIYDGFDILNSRHLYSKVLFKEGISLKNFKNISIKVQEISEYIKTLKYEDGSLVINSKKGTGFKGMIFSLRNILNIFNNYLKPVNQYLLSYKFSQDHLEMFFSALRSSGGYNNNPSAYNFVKIFKQLLIHANVKGSDKGNCISQDETEILKVPLNVWTQFNDNVPKLI